MPLTVYKRLLRRPAPRLGVQQLEDRTVPALFAAPTQVAATGLNNNGHVVVGDLNKDGNPDAVMANFGFGYGALAASKVTVLFGNGAGGYTSTINVSTGGKNISYVDLGDVNGDGWLDIAAGNATTGGNQSDGSSVAILLNNQSAAGGFTPAVGSPVSTGGFRNLSSVDLADVNADGKLDLIANHFGFDNGSTVVGQGIAIFAGDGGGKFALLGNIDPTTNQNLGIEFIPTNAQAADLNGDSVVDIVCTVPGIDLSGNNDPGIDGFVYLFAGTGGGAFAAQPTTFGSGGGLPLTLTLADVDGKNGLDVLVANAGNPNATPEFKGSAIGVLINNGGGGFGEGAVSTHERGTFGVAAADFNLDGKIDLAAANYGSQDGSVDAFVSVYYGNGTGGFVPATLDGSPVDTGYGEGGAQFLAVGDFDVNGTPDLIIAHAPKSSLSTAVVQLKNLSVPPAATSVTIESSANPSGFGGSVTFTATVTSGGTGLTAGTVTFFDGGNPLSGAVPLGAGGVATFNTSTLSVGTHPVTAKYSGAAGFAPSTSPVVSQVVNQASTLSILQSSAASVVSGTPVTFTVTVSSSSGTPTGTVTFTDSVSGQIGGTFNLDAQGKASVTTSALSVGSHTVTAVYAGNASFAGSTSNSVSVTVTNPTPPPVDPTVTLQSSANPSSLNSAVTFTVTVSATTGTPTGTVTFFDGADPISGAVTLAGTPSKATFVTSTLGVGSHPITAKYSGATGFNPATSGILTQTVNPTTTTVALATDTSPATVTLPVTFTATVGAASGTPAGSVQFFDAGTAISGLIAIGGDGKAVFTTTALPVGSRSITAGFVPANGNFAASTSPPLAQLVNKAGVTITVSSGGPAVVTQPVTLTATLVEVPAITPDATGQVTFKLNGATILGSVPVSGGKAVLTTSTLPVGGGTITAEYAGDANFSLANSAGFTQLVDKAGVTVTLLAGGPATVGQNVTFLATLTESPDISLSPTGLVTFKLNGTTIATVAASGNTAQFSTATLPVGDNTLTAEYAGDASFTSGTSAPLTQQIVPIGTSVGVGTSASTVTVTVPVTLSATVAAAAGTPAGNVQFFSGGTAISGLIPLNSGKATFNTAGLPVGTTAITAQYIPTDPSFSGSTSPALTQVVAKANSGMTVTVDVAAPGQPSTLRSVVTKPTGVSAEPGGTVTFKVNGTVVGTAPLVGGQASTTTVLPAGTSNVTTEYDGDGNFTTVAATATATTSGGTAGQKPGLVGYKEFGVGAGAGRTADARFFNPDGTERFTAGSLFGGTGGVRVTSADFNNDGVADLVAGTGPGGASRVVVLDGKSKAVLFSVDPFEASFTGGVYVAAGDVTGDGVPDVVISPDEGGGPRVRVFSGAGGKFGQVDDFFGIDDPDFRGGARAAVADMNGDGVGELVVAAGFGGGPRVAVFDGTGLGNTRRKLFPDFFVFEQGLRNGAFVAAGDVDGDGKADLISGGGPGGGPRVTITSGAARLNGQETVIANFFAGDSSNRGGVRVAARDLDGDNKADLVVGSGTGAGSRVTAYAGKAIVAKSDGPAELFGFDAFPGFDGGVYVG